MIEKKHKLNFKNRWPFYLLNHGVKTVYETHTLPSFLYAYFIVGIKFIMRHHFPILVCLSILYVGMRIEARISRLMERIVVETSTSWPDAKSPSQNANPLIDSLISRYGEIGKPSINGNWASLDIYLGRSCMPLSPSYKLRYLPPPWSPSEIDRFSKHSIPSMRKAEIEKGDVEIFVSEKSVPNKPIWMSLKR